MEDEWGLEVLPGDHRVGFAMGLVGALVAAAAGAFGPGLSGGFLADGLLRGVLEFGDAGLSADQQVDYRNLTRRAGLGSRNEAVCRLPAAPGTLPPLVATGGRARKPWIWRSLMRGWWMFFRRCH